MCCSNGQKKSLCFFSSIFYFELCFDTLSIYFIPLFLFSKKKSFSFACYPKSLSISSSILFSFSFFPLPISETSDEKLKFLQQTTENQNQEGSQVKTSKKKNCCNRIVIEKNYEEGIVFHLSKSLSRRRRNKRDGLYLQKKLYFYFPPIIKNLSLCPS